MTEAVSPSPATKRKPWLVPVVVAVVAVVGLGVGIAVAAQQDSKAASPALSSASQVVGVQQACRDWAGTTRTGPNDQWCDDMAGWMTQQMASGSAGTMMWGNPAAVAAMCQRWAQTNNATASTTSSDVTATTADPSASWCQEMAGWMRGEWGDDDWDSHMRGPMMGN